MPSDGDVSSTVSKSDTMQPPPLQVTAAVDATTMNATSAGKSSFRRLQLLVYPETGRISLGLCALAVNSVTNLSFPWLMGKAVDLVADTGNS